MSFATSYLHDFHCIGTTQLQQSSRKEKLLLNEWIAKLTKIFNKSAIALEPNKKTPVPLMYLFTASWKIDQLNHYKHKYTAWLAYSIWYSVGWREKSTDIASRSRRSTQLRRTSVNWFSDGWNNITSTTGRALLLFLDRVSAHSGCYECGPDAKRQGRCCILL